MYEALCYVDVSSNTNEHSLVITDVFGIVLQQVVFCRTVFRCLIFLLSLFHSSFFSFPTKSLAAIMSGKKRKATTAAAAAAAAAAAQPSAKQRKLASTKEGKKEKAEGWLQDLVKQHRSDNMDMKVNKKRVRFISDTQEAKEESEGVLYWMLRDQRVQGEGTISYIEGREICKIFLVVIFLFFLDNWALIHAQRLAMKKKLPLHICACLFVPKSELSTLRHYSFMLKGLEEVEKVPKCHF